MTKRIEELSRRRQLGLLANVAGFLLWRVPQLDMLSDGVAASSRMVENIGGFGYFLWIATLVWLLWTFRKKLNSNEREALNDELVCAIRLRSSAVGYGATMLACGILMVAAVPLGITGSDTAHMAMIVGVCVPLVAYVIIELRYG